MGRRLLPLIINHCVQASHGQRPATVVPTMVPAATFRRRDLSSLVLCGDGDGGLKVVLMGPRFVER